MTLVMNISRFLEAGCVFAIAKSNEVLNLWGGPMNEQVVVELRMNGDEGTYDPSEHTREGVLQAILYT